MTPGEVRAKYLEFFKSRGHTIVPSSPLVPQNDPTTLFTGSGMQPMIPYLLGKAHPEGTRIVDSQKCFRSGDIEEVGDNRHTTFFEMLGNWSLGDYFRREQLPWIFAFLTDPEEGLGLDPHKLYVTAFIGDEKNAIPKDVESGEIWQKLFKERGIDAKIVDLGSEEDGYTKGMSDGRIFYYDAKKNWWSRAGTPDQMPIGEPGGPDSEMFYDFGTQHDQKWGEHCHPNCDCGRFVEIGNSVFMTYIKKADGVFELLPKQNIDFGGGLERITMAANDNADVFAVNHKPIIELLQNLSGKQYQIDDSTYMKAFRIIADHMKGAVFLIAAGVLPSNTDKGYFVRRLLRRSIMQADKLGVPENAFAQVVAPIAQMYSDIYPDLLEQTLSIADIITKEEERFRQTLMRGVKELSRYVSDGAISAQNAFQLFTTYGFPLELIIEEAGEKGIKQIDIEGFKELLKAHQDLSRAGSEQKFKGGLADTSEKTTRLHTAHHLLLKALQTVLGPSVKQRGSNITQERLRIDFNWGEKMTDAQKAEVERLVNEKIQEDLPVTHNELEKETAENLHAEHEFGAKYPDRVSVYAIGPKGATESNPQLEASYSLEFCGGPHAESTGQLAGAGGPEAALRDKPFKILKEEAVSAGVRRIRAVLQ